MNEDPSSLDRLHDLVVPPPVSWWPPAPGWWIIIGSVSLLSVIMAFRFLIRWQAGRYRSEALAILDDPATSPDQWAAILKRCALACWPRSSIASLTGQAWDSFFDRSGGKNIAPARTAARIEELAFSGNDAAEAEALKPLARAWIRHHQRRDVP